MLKQQLADALAWVYERQEQERNYSAVLDEWYRWLDRGRGPEPTLPPTSLFPADEPHFLVAHTTTKGTEPCARWLVLAPWPCARLWSALRETAKLWVGMLEEPGALTYKVVSVRRLVRMPAEGAVLDLMPEAP